MNHINNFLRSAKSPRWFCLLAGCALLSNAFAELGVAEFKFDKRYESAEDFATIPRPEWVRGFEQVGGIFQNDPGAWHVPATAADGAGKLSIGLDRSKINGDLAATILVSAEQTSDIAVQLFDEHGQAVVVDLFGNLIDVGGTLSTNTYIINLNKYPTAMRIVLRQIHGPVTVFGVVLFPVATEGEMVMAEVKKLAQRLGDPLSPENPIFTNLNNIATNANAIISKSAARPPVVSRSGKSLATLAQMRPAGCMMQAMAKMNSSGCICGPGENGQVLTSTSKQTSMPTLGDAPVIQSVRSFKKPISILVEDSHGGTDIYNENNFGSAQLGRILTAQGAKVVSTRNAPGFDSATGLTRQVLDQYRIVIFNGRFNGRTKPFTESEIQVVTEWVKEGGGLLVTCASPNVSDKMDAFYLNPLIAPFRLQFASREVSDSFFAVNSSDTHSILRGLEGFYVLHGTGVAGQADSQDVLPSGKDSVMLAQEFGAGRVIAFGAGSALKNKALNSRVVHHSPKQRSQLNTKLAMNLALWLAGVDE